MCVSNRFRMVGLAAAFAVVAIHCPQTASWNGGFVRIATLWAVPWFFFTSGVFCAQSLRKYDVADLLKKKSVSLVLPFVAWEIVGFAFGYHGHPYIWFLRSLIVFTFTAIVLRRLYLRTVLLCVLVLMVLWGCVQIPTLKCAWMIGTPTSPYYFILGLWASRLMIPPPPLRKRGVLCVCLWVFCSILTMLRIGHDFAGGFGMVIRNLHCVSVASALWTTTGLAHSDGRLSRIAALPWVSATLFVYLFHFIPVNIFGGFLGLPYLLTWVLATVVSFSVALVLMRFVPRLYYVVAGGRVERMKS